MTTPEEAWSEIRRTINMSWLAEQFNLTPAAVAAWTRAPAERVVEIEHLTGIARERLRPDLYPRPEPWSAL